MQFSSVVTLLVAMMASQTFASPARGNGGNALASKEGQPCTGSVSNLQRQGKCNANGKCAIDIPPNETDNVASKDCE
ncbi:hypothetical protein CcaCcLH18_11268 [Colletotrichum camelliae]|nr:hypothetical protein CcaCcLH18_11268 [Colletotrichum camelliae]